MAYSLIEELSGPSGLGGGRASGSVVTVEAYDRLRTLRVASIQLLLPAEDGAPLLVLGDGHAAFHADTYPLSVCWSIR